MSRSLYPDARVFPRLRALRGDLFSRPGAHAPPRSGGLCAAPLAERQAERWDNNHRVEVTSTEKGLFREGLMSECPMCSQIFQISRYGCDSLKYLVSDQLVRCYEKSDQYG